MMNLRWAKIYSHNSQGYWDEGPWSKASLPKQCCMNSVIIDKVLKSLASIPSEITNAIQVVNPFNATNPITIPLKLNIVTSSFDMRKATWEKHEDEDNPKINSWQKHQHGIHSALSLVGKNRVFLTTEDVLSSLTLQQGDNYLSTLSQYMRMMLQMLWIMTTVSPCWKILSSYILCK